MSYTVYIIFLSMQDLPTPNIIYLHNHFIVIPILFLKCCTLPLTSSQQVVLSIDSIGVNKRTCHLDINYFMIF